MNRPVRPMNIAPPAANYELAMLVPAGASLLYTSGIVATRPDGTIAEDIGEQAAEIWKSIGALLEEAEMTVANIVSYTTYAVVGHDLGSVMLARDRFFGDHRASSTLISVASLARPEWKVEVAVIAAH